MSSRTIFLKNCPTERKRGKKNCPTERNRDEKNCPTGRNCGEKKIVLHAVILLKNSDFLKNFLRSRGREGVGTFINHKSVPKKLSCTISNCPNGFLARDDFCARKGRKLSRIFRKFFLSAHS